MADKKVKEFGLKPIETQMLNTIINQQGTMLSNMISFIAMERLAITVTPNTRFNLTDDMTKIEVSEVEPEDIKPEAETGEIVETPTKKG